MPPPPVARSAPYLLFQRLPSFFQLHSAALLCLWDTNNAKSKLASRPAGKQAGRQAGRQAAARCRPRARICLGVSSRRYFCFRASTPLRHPSSLARTNCPPSLSARRVPWASILKKKKTTKTTTKTTKTTTTTTTNNNNNNNNKRQQQQQQQPQPPPPPQQRQQQNSQPNGAATYAQAGDAGGPLARRAGDAAHGAREVVRG